MIEGIKQGEVRNNKAALERLEIRYSDQFRNEAHKKPRKKMKGRDSTIQSTLKNIFEWQQLVLTVGGTHISILIVGIKHSMSPSYKSSLHCEKRLLLPQVCDY